MPKARHLAWILPILAFALYGLPWDDWAGQLLRRELGKRGLVVACFTVDGLSMQGLRFRDVHVTAPVAVTIPALALDLSRAALLQRRWGEAVSHVRLEGMALHVERGAQGALSLNGQPLPASSEAPAAGDPAMLVGGLLARLMSFPEIDAVNLPFSYRQPGLRMETILRLQSRRAEKGGDLRIEFAAPRMELTQGTLGMPLLAVDLAYRNENETPTAHAIFSYAATQWKAPGQEATFDGSTRIDLPPRSPLTSETRWKNLHAQMGRMEADLPELILTAAGSRDASPLPLALRLQAAGMQVSGLGEGKYRLDLRAQCEAGERRLRCPVLHAQLPAQKAEAEGKATLSYADPHHVQWSMQGSLKDWMGGTIRLQADAPGGGGLVPLALDIRAEKLALAPVMAMLAEGKVSATGSVSGAVPVIWLGGQELRFGEGALTADAPGTLRLAPELLASGNANVALVGGILADLHYRELRLSLAGDAQNRLKARLSVLGNNPAALDGRSVKLNVNLSGDLLSLLKYSILPMSDPKQWLQTPSDSPR